MKAWEECKHHSIQTDSIMIGVGERVGLGKETITIPLIINCFYCGCPAEVNAKIYIEDIEWRK